MVAFLIVLCSCSVSNYALYRKVNHKMIQIIITHSAYWSKSVISTYLIFVYFTVSGFYLLFKSKLFNSMI